MKFRLVERAWDIPRRRYAVERLAIETPDFQHWSIERFFSAPLDAQLFMATLSKGPRVISKRESPGGVAGLSSNLGDKALGPDHVGPDGL